MPGGKMNSRVRVIFYAMMIVLLALLSAFSVIPARADDGAPPPAVPAAPSAPKAAEVTTAAAPTVLSQVPAGTDVVVVNTARHKVSLASQEAAKIVAANDPIWCPTGVVPGGVTCSLSGSSLSDLFGWLYTNNWAKAGTIWIESGYDNTDLSNPDDNGIPDFGLYGLSLTNTAKYALTVNGGWSGMGTTLNFLAPSTIDGASLSIYDWKNSVTLNNLVIENAPTSTNNPDGTGLTVTTTGSIVLNNINAINNQGEGAYLDNCYENSFSICTGTGTVTLNYSSFEDNKIDGLDVYTSHAISAKNLTALDNTEDGAYLDNCIFNTIGGPCTITTAQPVTITNVNNFSYNASAGLVVWSRGAITVSNVTAVYNTGSFGAILDNCNLGATACTNAGSYAVTLKGNNNFSNNNIAGLDITATGPITANNITAYDNIGYGAYLDNSEDFGAKALTLTGTNSFSDNVNDGLWINSLGAITLSNITASDNAGRGAYIDNQWDYKNYNLTLSGYNTFNDNYLIGLEAYSNGNILISNLTANENGGGQTLTGNFDGGGAYLSNYSLTKVPVTVTLTGNNTFNTNGVYDDINYIYTGYGLIVYSDGAITISNLTANENVEGGAYLDNWDRELPKTPRNITLTGTNVLSNTSFGDGLEAYSAGAITLSNVTASNNLLYGAYLDNCGYDSVNDDCNGLVSEPVTLTGKNTFNTNLQGLWVYSLGAITASNLTANNNVIGGAYLDNQWDFKNYNITLSGYNTFNDNQDSTGLEAYSNGNILMSNLTANGNPGEPAYGGSQNTGGVYLDNHSLTTVPVTVTLTGNNTFNANGYYDSFNDVTLGDGLLVYSDGAITASNLTANDNYEDGAYLDNWDREITNAPRNITLTGVNTFLNNGADGYSNSNGLEFYASGAASLTEVMSHWNWGDGVIGSVGGNITLTCGNMDDNGGSGYDLTTPLTVGKTITLKGVYSNDNGDWDYYTTPKLLTGTCPLP
jgi:hypothetical protein